MNGTLCARCNYCYATSLDEQLPVCDQCKSKKDIKKEPTRNCPVDGEAMTKHLVKNVMIDKCPKCHGVWLDGNEVAILHQGIDQEDPWSTDSGFWKGLVVGAIIS